MSDKTEQPTSKKLREAREKGQVAKSKEIPSAAIIIAVFIVIWVSWDSYLNQMKELVLLPTLYYEVPFKEGLKMMLQGVGYKILVLSAPVIMTALIMAIMANFFQIGALFSIQSITPDLNKINPAEGIKKIFSKDNLIEFLKSLVKILFLSYLIYKVIKESIDPLLKLPFLGIDGIMPVLGALLKKVVIYTIFAFSIVAAADFFLQKHQHIKKLMMTKEEVKQEYKEMEGDPHIKSKRKQLHREMVMNDTAQRTKKASVLVTNPTHLAVALYYDKDKTKLPMIVAKGEDLIAKRMIDIAQEEGIPIMQNVPLAQDLFHYGELDNYIPSNLIEAVAEVLKWVQTLTKNK
ncbi:MAG: type III secretion system export apparatus subunit SctU [Desulfobacterales bacterium]|nr:type III secretion system export apparatus subunit SctU [Desulfobacterales bacterium]